MKQKDRLSWSQCVQANLLLAGPEPTMMDSVLCRGKNAFRLVQFEGPEGDMDTDLVKVSLLLSPEH